MVYHSHSYRHAVMLPVSAVIHGAWRDPARRAEFVRSIYDAGSDGTAAPATEFSSIADVRRMFSSYADVHVRRENFDDFVLAARGVRFSISRKVFLNNLGRIAGLDLYVTATR
jgi:hypothetical protein